ncbi:family 10 glycosylhydrolase [Leptolyngbya sp. NK1-12]|uniref:Family 10 glycosylhydrolase n=1 Tax=Leptolyngbya sp. NK1-12 TaxID=2547451 RepID=A0AA96WIN9_9CYAN|nr:family 10 glycosylhydrolase [Leptolyngbya sp. NK1-12]
MSQFNSRLLSLWVVRLVSIAPALLMGGLFNDSPAAALPTATQPQHLGQAQTQPAPILGVVRSADNQAQWADITARLDASGLTYRVIDWNAVQRSTDFGDITVLFLPNVQTITSEQLLGVQAWLNRGGRLIVSGAAGSQSSAGVQNALRSLLGAYWASDLSQPQTLQPLQIASQRWVRGADTGSTVLGGVIVPTSLASQPVVVWDRTEQPNLSAGASSGAAVVVTQKSTFLGWRWGDQSSSLAEFDTSWLRAAVSRFEGIFPVVAATPAPMSGSAITTVPAPQSNRTSNPAPSGPVAVTSPRTAPPPPRATTSRETSDNPAGTASRNTRQPNRQVDVTRLLNRAPQTAPTSTDPAEQVAPVELEVHRSGARITLYEATTMRQELENLIGRYESALILASSRSNTQSNTQLNQAQSGAKVGDVVQVATNSAELLGNGILAQARQGYTAFSEALNQRDYAAARQQWLATRQLLWQNFPLDRPLSQPEVRAIWLDRGTIVQAGSRQGLAQIFDRLAAAGINTVFFETVNAGYPIYPSRVAPEQNPLTRHWDPLAAAVELADARGMELHAWVWTFAAGNQVHNAILNQPASYPGPILAARPNWANYDNRGSLIPPGQTKPFLDPANPEVRAYLLSLFEEIVTRYDVDGLQLDYIRYPFQDPRAGGHTYGYGMAARQQFQRLTGSDPVNLSPSHPQWQQWTAFRTEQVNSFVADVSRLVHGLKPELILSTAVFALPERRRVNEIQQNWEVWAQRGDVDMIVLMSYARDTNGLQRLANPWLLENADLGTTLILPGIRLLNLSNETVVDQIQALRDSPSGGFALFAAENLNSGLQTIFRQIQGESAATSEPIPYRDPFATAASRYSVLLQQWNWLLENGQLQVRESQIEPWRSKTAALEQALQTLATDPSSANLQQARTLLRSFQTQFKTWMNLPVLSEAYRINTWQNQLETLETLLGYGERVVLNRPRLTRQQAVRQRTEQTAEMP